MINYILRRLTVLVATLFAASMFIFGVVRLIPGDFLSILLGTQRAALSEREILELQRLYGLDKPFVFQYWVWLGNCFQGNLGYSFRTGKPVTQEIARRALITIEIAVLATLLSLLSGVTLGVISATKRERFVDILIRVIALINLSIPPFWLGLIVIFLAASLFGWMPWGRVIPSVKENLVEHLILIAIPSLVMAMGMSGRVMRIARSALLEVIAQEYILTAFSKGLSNKVVWFKHALRNALIPIVTFSGMQFGYLLGGVVVIEHTFGLNGVGSLALNAVTHRDYPLLQGTILTIILGVSLVNLTVDVLYGFVDPRIRYD